MPPPVQYAKSGDLFIAYQVTGDGPVRFVPDPRQVLTVAQA